MNNFNEVKNWLESIKVSAERAPHGRAYELKVLHSKESHYAGDIGINHCLKLCAVSPASAEREILISVPYDPTSKDKYRNWSPENIFFADVTIYPAMISILTGIGCM